MYGRSSTRLLGRVLTFTFLFLLLGTGAPCVEDQTPLLRERAITAESFVNEKLWIWQRRLQLTDWKVTVKMVRSSELKPKTLGNIHWDSGTKTATVRVLALPEYTMPYEKALQDMEFTVVHELIHLQLSSLPRSEASRGAEERAVNQITQALLNLDRGN